MGYSADFGGQFDLNKPLAPEHLAYLKAFSISRRMKRNAKIVEGCSDPVRIAAGLPIGLEGGYFVGNAENDFGQENDESIDVNRGDHNHPPSDQPGLWCQWIPNDDGTVIEWDGTEKFHNYVEWLKYLIKHFIEPWGYVLNGEVEWQGEERSDIGKIIVKNNDVQVKMGRIVFS
ncbi:MAG: hypothetical protein WC390_10255 [Sulfurimonas sp.]|jgi:hypothetical protein